MEVGLFGKLPSHGDFLRRRASDAFVDGWDAWLQQCMTASRAALGERWLGVYLTAPAWRFVCAAGTCGDAPFIGLMAPSVDRVGRYFPLTLFAELPWDADIVTAARDSGPFFESAERLVIETLEAEPVDFDRFDAGVIELAGALAPLDMPSPLRLGTEAATVLEAQVSPGWHVPFGSPAHLDATLDQLLVHRLSAVYQPVGLWWTEGSSLVEPSCLVTRGLPAPASFAALLDGTWDQSRWRTLPVEVNGSRSPRVTVLETVATWRLRSAAASDVGLVRQDNEDAVLARPEIGLWAVADGLGGHDDGQVASRMVCDALADFEPRSSFDETIGAASERLQQVNEHLFRGATQRRMVNRSASTVVVLLVRGAQCAVLWAGDSRAYRLRAGALEQLTRDHSASEWTSGPGREDSNEVTRAIGVEPVLSLDLLRDEVLAGDRFLLCSDGLTRTVPAAQIRCWVEHGDLDAGVQGLVRATLDAGAPDNVSVIIAEAGSDVA